MAVSPQLLKDLQFTDKMEMEALLAARHTHPHAFLGVHPFVYKNQEGVVVRAFLANARSCQLTCIQSQRTYALNKVHDGSFFEAFIPGRSVFSYKFLIEHYNGEISYKLDPYAFSPTLSDYDLYLINNGVDYQVYKKLGSQVRVLNGTEGVSFAVWAPNAQRVSVVGDFNKWDGRYHPMRILGSSGIWELFIPGLEKGDKYKYEVITVNGEVTLKTDPYALFYEPPVHNASIVWSIDEYAWNDADWLKKRALTDWKRAPLSIYEVHAGSWKRIVEEGNRPLNYKELAHALVNYVKHMGFTHVEFMPLAEYPFEGSWGYQVTGFFAPTHRYGTPEAFMYLADLLHQNDIGIIMDWVPAHFPRDTFALADFDGTQLYEHADPRQRQHADWGTLIFNYGRNEVKLFLIGSLLSWAERFHIDGFRVDAVASMLYLDYSKKDGEWVANQYGGKENIEAIEFLRAANDVLHTRYPGVLTIAEESTAFGGVTQPTAECGLGFDFKWNMGWMHDTIRYCNQDPLYRKYYHNDLTFGMLYQYSECFIKCFSHDEVVHGKGSMLLKMSGSSQIQEKAHTLRALYGYMWFWPGKNTLFMGSEFGQINEWRFDHSLDWHLLNDPLHVGIQKLVKDLNQIYCNNPVLSLYDNEPGGFEWVNPHDRDNSIVSFIRKSKTTTDTFLIISNFTPVLRSHYRVGVSHQGVWNEILNTDSTVYEGQGCGNHGSKETECIAWNHRPYSLSVCVPGLSTLAFYYSKLIDS